MRDFYIGFALVVTQSAIGFWVYSPASQGAVALAIVASLVIPIGYLRKWSWARGAAMLVSVFTILGDATELAAASSKGLLVARIAFCLITLFWLTRQGVRRHFDLKSAKTL